MLLYRRSLLRDVFKLYLEFLERKTRTPFLKSELLSSQSNCEFGKQIVFDTSNHLAYVVAVKCLLQKTFPFDFEHTKWQLLSSACAANSS